MFLFERRATSAGSRARRGNCALPRLAGPILEPLEPRRLLDATGLLDVAESQALDGSTDISIPPIYTSVQDSDIQAAPVVEATALVTALSLDQTFLLHSNPGASKVIYLDFDGHTTTGTSWNVSYGDPIITPAFSFEGDTSSFTDNELSRIQYIWQRVAEDYLPFNVDVTTEDPGVDALIKSNFADAYYGIRACIGGDSSWYGTAVGGVAKVNSFNYSSDTPCFIFPANLGNGSEKYTAEAISHEVGHTLGLNHDGTTTGTEYYQGQGRWAPIMGMGYYKTITQWSKGEYTDANNTQDDLAIIAGSVGNFGYRADDHGSDIASADAMTTISTNVSADGIIERTSDVDFFSFTTGAGTVSFAISPAARGPNLDILAALYDSAGQVVSESNPIGALNASFSLSLDAGIYYLSIDGTGEGDPLTTGYSDYASLGYYSISGTIVDPGLIGEVTVAATDAAAAEAGLDTATFRFTRTGSTADAVEVFFTVSGSADAGADYQPIGNSVVIPAGASYADVVITPIDDTDPEGPETVVLTVDPGTGYYIGLANSAEATIADDDLLLSTFDYAVSETTTVGTVVGSSYQDTDSNDNVYEQISEVRDSSAPTTALVQIWTFNVTGPGSVTFFVEAYHDVNTDGDNFVFSWSADQTSWTDLVTITKTADDDLAQSAPLPDGLSGTVYIRATDTDQTTNDKSLDSLYVDQMYIRSDLSIAGDANADGVVDGLDYITLKTHLGQSGVVGWNYGDFDQDRDVDFTDFRALVTNMGRTFNLAVAAAASTAAAAVPVEVTATVPASPAETDPAVAATGLIDVLSGARSTAAEPVLADLLARETAGPVREESAGDTSPTAPAGVASKNSAARVLAAMADAARTARVDALAGATIRLPRPNFDGHPATSRLSWWHKADHDEDVLPAVE